VREPTMADIADHLGVSRQLVTIDQGSDDAVYDVVRSAGDVGIELLVRHLVTLGHRRLTYLDAPAMPPAASRLEGRTLSRPGPRGRCRKANSHPKRNGPSRGELP
jgi:hypothetical protein